MYVSANYFSSVGVVPAQGRIFNAADEATSQAQPVLVVSHRLWENRLGADPDIVGRTLAFNRVDHVVVGVAPDGFLSHLSRREASQADLWVPLPTLLANDVGLRRDRAIDWLRVFARLSPGTSLADANGAVSSVMSALAEQFPASNEYKAASVEPYTSTGANQRLEIGLITAMFFGLSGMVLLVVCLNVAGMVLVRSATRERELAVRLALGAGRSRLIRYLMSEAIVLALVGGSLSVAVVYGGSVGLAWWFDFPVPDAWRLNAPRVAACLTLSLVTTLVFGLLPSIRFSRPTIVRTIKDDAGGGGWRVGRIHRLAVAVQAGLALPFLVIGGLLIDGARTTATADLGFEPQGLFASALNVSAAGYADEDVGFLLRGVQKNLRRATGVVSVTVADGLPLDYDRRPTRVSLVGGAAQARGHTTRIGEDYLTTVGTPLLRGRGITDDDRAGGELVAVISESLATRLFPGKEAVGQRVLSALQGTAEEAFTIVGVTADAATSQLQTMRRQIFVPLAQHPAPRIFLIARAPENSQSITMAFENAIADLDPDFVRPTVITGTALVRDNIDDLLQQSTLAIVVAVVALTLSALGIYGVVAFMVATRRREIGVRMALGASRRRVLGGVLVNAFTLTVPGVAAGLILAVFLVRRMGLLGLWYPIGIAEPLVYAVAVGSAVTVALLASVPSARHAAAVQPIDAMRSE
jgi:predicted permease